MAKKFLDPFGKTPRVRVSLSEKKKAELLEHEWFIEPGNDDTRNAVASSLEPVDHEGDQIYYGGSVRHGFKAPFDRVLFLYNSTASNTWKFVAYHRKNRHGQWAEWKGGSKTPPERLRNLSYVFMKPGENPLKK